ncbi:MAG: DUF559 domain-containing protein [Methyloceanibacter sp.]
MPRGPLRRRFSLRGSWTELDGSQHLELERKHNAKRTALLQREGLKVLRCWKWTYSKIWMEFSP